jgi:hypothetical protein
MRTGAPERTSGARVRGGVVGRAPRDEGGQERPVNAKFAVRKSAFLIGGSVIRNHTQTPENKGSR